MPPGYRSGEWVCAIYPAPRFHCLIIFTFSQNSGDNLGHRFHIIDYPTEIKIARNCIVFRRIATLRQPHEVIVDRTRLLFGDSHLTHFSLGIEVDKRKVFVCSAELGTCFKERPNSNGNQYLGKFCTYGGNGMKKVQQLFVSRLLDGFRKLLVGLDF